MKVVWNLRLSKPFSYVYRRIHDTVAVLQFTSETGIKITCIGVIIFLRTSETLVSYLNITQRHNL